MKEKAILSFHAGEIGWEILRTTPHVLWMKKRHPDAKLIVCTREDRYDLYGKCADIFEPLIIEGDGELYKGNCFTLTNFSEKQYSDLSTSFKKKYEKKYEIIRFICPNVKGSYFSKKDQFNQNKMIFDLEPRIENINLINNIIPNNKPLVVLAPRFRRGFPRNWNNWNTLYDLIAENKFLKRFNFILCGKDPDYIPDKNDRFYDVNKIKLIENTSLVGITMASIKKAVLTVGSQSGIPNLSNLLGTPTLQWGHQEWFHTKTYNIKNTPTKFLNCKTKKDFNAISAKVVFNELKEQLRGKDIKHV